MDHFNKYLLSLFYVLDAGDTGFKKCTASPPYVVGGGGARIKYSLCGVINAVIKWSLEC